MLDPIRVLDEMLQSRPEQVGRTLQATCAAVRKAAPHACEHIFENYVIGAVFTFTGKLGGAFCHPVAYAGHVNLGFNRGVELADPKGLLEGTGKLIRHLRVDGPATLRRRAVRDLIEQAVAQGLALANHSGVVPRVVTDPATRDAAKVGARRSGRAAKGKAAAKK